MALSSELIREYWANGALQGFVETLTPLSVFSTDFGGEIGNPGQIVNVQYYRSGGSVANFAGDYTTGADKTVDNVKVTIDGHKFVPTVFTDVEAANSVASIERMGVQMGADLALSVSQDILSVVTAANYGAAAFTGAASLFESDTVVDIKTVCDNAQMPRIGRAMILSNSYYNGLLKDDSIKHATNYGSSEGIQMGMIPNLSGFKTYEADGIPANSENLVGFACVPEAIALAVRYLAPQEGHKYSYAAAMEDPGTGLVLGVREFYSELAGKKYMALECNWGKSVAIAAGLKRIVSA